MAATASFAFAGTLDAQTDDSRLAVTLTHSVGSSTSAHPPPCSVCGGQDLLAPVSVTALELELAIPLRLGHRSGLEYQLRLVPLLILRNNPVEAAIRTRAGWSLPSTAERRSTLGLGAKPAGLRGWVGLGRFRAEADLAVGLLWFGTPALAANGARMNFVGEVGLGLRFPWPASSGATFGYRRHHVSNAGLADVNPGLNSHVLFVSVPLG